MFYDMLRQPIHCPKCGAAFRADAPPVRRPAKAAPKSRAPRARKEAPLPTVDSGPPEIAGRATDVVEEIDDPEAESEIDDSDDDVIEEDGDDDEADAVEITPDDAVDEREER
jgi:hypothetical protein